MSDPLDPRLAELLDQVLTSPLVPEGEMYVASPSLTDVSTQEPLSVAKIKGMLLTHTFASNPYYFMHPKDYEAWRFRQRCDAESTPIYDEIKAKHDRAELRHQIREVNRLNAEVQAGFRRLDQVRKDAGVAPGQPLLGEKYFPKES
jgi:hypothetical protein